MDKKDMYSYYQEYDDNYDNDSLDEMIYSKAPKSTHKYYSETGEKDYNYLDIYNTSYAIRLQDIFIQKLPKDFINAKQLDKVNIKNITTEFYDNGYAYNYYYGWINLFSPENNNKDIIKQVHSSQNTIKMSILSYFSTLAILIMIAFSNVSTIISLITILLIFPTFFIMPIILAYISYKKIKKNHKELKEIVSNGKIIKEPDNFRKARVKANLEKEMYDDGKYIIEEQHQNNYLPIIGEVYYNNLIKRDNRIKYKYEKINPYYDKNPEDSYNILPTSNTSKDVLTITNKIINRNHDNKEKQKIYYTDGTYRTVNGVYRFTEENSSTIKIIKILKIINKITFIGFFLLLMTTISPEILNEFSQGYITHKFTEKELLTFAIASFFTPFIINTLIIPTIIKNKIEQMKRENKHEL